MISRNNFTFVDKAAHRAFYVHTYVLVWNSSQRK